MGLSMKPCPWASHFHSLILSVLSCTMDYMRLREIIQSTREAFTKQWLIFVSLSAVQGGGNRLRGLIYAHDPGLSSAAW